MPVANDTLRCLSDVPAVRLGPVARLHDRLDTLPMGTTWTVEAVTMPRSDAHAILRGDDGERFAVHRGHVMCHMETVTRCAG